MEKKQYQGLNRQQVEENRNRYGENVLTPPKKASLWSQFIEKFEDPIIRILLVAWFLSMIIAGVHCWGPEAQGFTAFLEPLGIFFAIILATGVGFAFEVKANKAFSVLNTVNDDTMVKVIREGNISQVLKKEVVVGDLVLLETGEEIPADGHLLEAVSLQVNESTLTGEPLTSKTVNEADFDPDATYPSNVVMRGTTVADGHAKRLYELIRKRTIASQMADAEMERTTISINMNGTSERFVATGEVLKFEGFLQVYLESNDDEEEKDQENGMLPPVTLHGLSFLY